MGEFNMEKKYVISDYRISEESIDNLNKYGINVIKTTPLKCLYEAVNGHPDMQLHYFERSNELLCAKEAYNYYKTVIPKGINLICDKEVLKDKYPYDILYNSAVIGNHVICNEKYTSKELLDKYKLDGKKIINVKQGYAKCSIAVIGQNAAITADEGIYKRLINSGIDTLKIQPGSIKLNTMSYGFIGGCCGLIKKNLLAVNGNLNLHPQSREIINFCEKHNVNIVELSKNNLYDIGSIIAIYNISSENTITKYNKS